MKILLLNYEFPPMGGGASVATFNIAKQLVFMGNRIDVLTSRINDQKKEEIIDGVKIYRVKSLRHSIHDCGICGAFSFLLCAAFKFILLTKKNNYDILIYFFSLPTGALSLLPGKHRKIPYIISLRGSDVPLYDPYNKKLQIFHKHLMPVTKHIWKNATSIIALSDSLRKKALKTYPGLTINVIPNGIESHIFRPCKSNYNVKNFKIITVSRLIERKGIQHILKALAELRKEDATIKNLFLLIVGTGKYEYQLKYLCKQLNLNNIVTFYGFCPRSDLPKLYGQSDIFILPSLAESFGVVFAEAMSCGLPIIASNVGAIPDLVDDINGILVEPGNPSSLKEAIKYMINNKNKWYSMGSASRAKICEQYSWESIAQKYSYICSLGVYSSIIEKPLSSLETVRN